MGISMPLVELMTTELDSTGAIAIKVALRTPCCRMLVRRVSQSSSGSKLASSLAPAARRSQGNSPWPYRVLLLCLHAPRSRANSTVASVK